MATASSTHSGSLPSLKWPTHSTHGSPARPVTARAWMRSPGVKRLLDSGIANSCVRGPNSLARTKGCASASEVNAMPAAAA